MIGLGTGELRETPETGNDILIDIYGKIRIQYVVYDPEPDVRHGEWGTMDVTLSASDASGFVDLGLYDESRGMVGAQSIVGIPQYNMIVKYDLKEYAD